LPAGSSVRSRSVTGTGGIVDLDPFTGRIGGFRRHSAVRLDEAPATSVSPCVDGALPW